MNSSVSNITEKRVLEILTQARHHELCRQVNEGMECLKEFWADHTVKPSLTGFSEPVQGEILLRCGTFLSYWGHYKQLKNCNEPAKNWLTEAIEIFSNLNYQEKVAETEIEMAMAYWRAGEYEEAQPWLENAEIKITNPLSAVSVKLYACFLLNYYKLDRLTEAIEITKEKDFLVELSEDSRVKVHYYINSALAMYNAQKYPEALERYEIASKFCREVGNQIYLGIAENNSAVTCSKLKLYDKALVHLDVAYQLAVETQNKGDQASMLDTKARIHLSTGNLERALECVEQSIGIFEKGDENYAAFVESLWTRIRIWIRLGNITEAITGFSSLYQICLTQISEKEAVKYATKFKNLIYINKGKSFDEEVLEFEQFLIERAHAECGGLITSIAESLQISHQTLSNALNSRHKKLRNKLGIKPRAKRSRSIPVLFETEQNPINKSAEKDSQAANFNNPDYEVVKHSSFRIGKPKHVKIDVLFEISTDRLKNIGLSRGFISVITRESSYVGHFPSVVRERDSGQTHTGFMTEFGGLIGLETESSEPLIFMPEEIQIIGKIIGYLRPEGDIYIFQALNC